MTRVVSVDLGTERGSAVSLASRPSFDAVVAQHLGIPYRHGGRGPDGIDCLGLVLSVYRAFGIALPDGDGQPIAPDWWQRDPDRYLRGLLQHGEAVSGELRPLDLVYFRIGGVVRHAGVMVDTQRFIHVLEHRPVMVTRLGSWWSRRLAGARRIV